MITTDDVKHLADLARIELSDAEAETFTGELDSILAYVGQIQEVVGDSKRIAPSLSNVMRDDVVKHQPYQFTESILANAPAREKNYLKVKKILGNSDDAI